MTDSAPAMDETDGACGDNDPCNAIPALGSRLMPFDDALATGLGLVSRPVPMETVSLGHSIGRVLAGRACTPVPMPAFDHAAMDGYALRHTDLAGPGPWRLTVAGRIAAGDKPASSSLFPPGTAVRILTGAPVPPPFDAIVMQENATRHGD